MDRCIRTNSELGSKEWRREPNCNCHKCSEYFYKLRTMSIDRPDWMKTKAEIKAQLEAR